MSDNRFIGAGDGYQVTHYGDRVVITRTEPDNTLDGREDVVIQNLVHAQVLKYDAVNAVWMNKEKTFEDTNTVYQMELVESEYGAQIHLVGSDGVTDIVEFQAGTGMELLVEFGQLTFNQITPVVQCTTESDPLLNKYIIIDTGLGAIVTPGQLVMFIPAFDNTGPAKLVIEETGIEYPIVQSDGSELSPGYLPKDVPVVVFYDSEKFYLGYNAQLAFNAAKSTQADKLFFFTGAGKGELIDITQVGRDVLQQQTTAALAAKLKVVPKQGGAYKAPVGFNNAPQGIALPTGTSTTGGAAKARYNPTREAVEGHDGSSWSMLLTEQQIEEQPRIVTQKPYRYSGDFDIPLPGQVIVEPFANREYIVRLSTVDATGYTNSNILLSGDTFTLMESQTSSGTILARFGVVTDVQIVSDYYEFRVEVVEDAPDWAAPTVGMDIFAVTVFVRGTGLDSDIAFIYHDSLKRINTPGSIYQHITEEQLGDIGVVNSVTVAADIDDPINGLVVTNTLHDAVIQGGSIPDGLILTLTPVEDNTGPVTITFDGVKAGVWDAVAQAELAAGAFIAGIPVKLYWSTDRWIFIAPTVYVNARQHNTLLEMNTGDYQHLTVAQKALLGQVGHLSVSAAGDTITLTPSLMKGLVDGNGDPIDNLVLSFVTPITNATDEVLIKLGNGEAKPLHRTPSATSLGVGGIIRLDIVTIVYDAAKARWVLEQIPVNPDVKTNFYAVMDDSTPTDIRLDGNVDNAIVFEGVIPNDTVVTFVPPSGCQGATTLTIDADIGSVIGTGPIVREDSSPVVAGDWKGDTPVSVKWDLASQRWVLVSLMTQALEIAEGITGTTPISMADNVLANVPVTDTIVPVLGATTPAAQRQAIGSVGETNYYKLEGTESDWVVTPRLPGYNIHNGVIPYGFVVNVIAQYTNTGAVNVTIDGVAYPLQLVEGVDLVANTILKGKNIEFTFRDTYWELALGWSTITDHDRVLRPNAVADLQHATARHMQQLVDINKFTVETVDGNTLDISFSADDEGLMAGGIPNGFTVKFAPTMNNTGPVTVNFGSDTTAPLVDKAGAELVADTLKTSELAIISWKEGKWYFIEPKMNLVDHDYLSGLNAGNYQHLTPAEKARITAMEVVSVIPPTGVVLADVDAVAIPLNGFDTLTFETQPRTVLNDYPASVNTNWASLEGWVWTTDATSDGTGAENIGNMNDGSVTSGNNNYFGFRHLNGMKFWALEFPTPRVFGSMKYVYSTGAFPGNFINVKYVDENGDVVFTDVDCKGGAAIAGSSPASTEYISQYKGTIKKLIFECDTSQTTQATSGHVNYSFYAYEVDSVITYQLSDCARTLLFADGEYYAIGADGLTLIGASPDWNRGVYEGVVDNAWLVSFSAAQLVTDVVGAMRVEYVSDNILLVTNFLNAFVDTPMPVDYIVDYSPIAPNAPGAKLSFNGANALPLTDAAGDPLLGGEMVAGRRATVVYKGTHWVYIKSGLGQPAHNGLTDLDAGEYQHLTAEERKVAGKVNQWTVAGVDALTLTSLSGYAFRDGLDNDAVIEFIAASTNTDAMTIAIDDIPAAGLVMGDGTPVAAGYIQAGDHVLVRYDSVTTSWCIVEKKPAAQRKEFHKVSGSVNAIVLTSSVGKLSITVDGVIPVGKVIEFMPMGNNTAATTLNLDARGAKAVVDSNFKPLVANAIKLDRLCRVEWDGSQWVLESQTITEYRDQDGASGHYPIVTTGGDVIMSAMHTNPKLFNALETAAEMRAALGVSDKPVKSDNDVQGALYVGVAANEVINAYREPGRIGWGYHAELLLKNATITSSVNMIADTYSSTPLAEGNELVTDISEYHIAIGEFDELSFTTRPSQLISTYPSTTNNSWTTLNGWVWGSNSGGPNLGNVNDNASSSDVGSDELGFLCKYEGGKDVTDAWLEFPEEVMLQSIEATFRGLGPGHYLTVNYFDVNGNIVYVDEDCRGGAGTIYTSQYTSGFIKKIQFVQNTALAPKVVTDYSTDYSFTIGEMLNVYFIAKSAQINTLLFADGNYYTIADDSLTLIGPEVDWEQGVKTGLVKNEWLAGFTDAKLEMEYNGAIDVTFNSIQPQIAIQTNGIGIAQVMSVDAMTFDDADTSIKMFVSRDGVEYFTLTAPGVFESVGSLLPNSQSAILIGERGFDKAMMSATDIARWSEWLGIFDHTASMIYWAYGHNNPAAVIVTHTLSGTFEGGYTVQPSAAFTYWPDHVSVPAPTAGDYLININ